MNAPPPRSSAVGAHPRSPPRSYAAAPPFGAAAATHTFTHHPHDSAQQQPQQQPVQPPLSHQQHQQHQQLHLPGVQTYIHNYHYYNFNADCTINQSLGDGQNLHIISSQPQRTHRPPHGSQVNPIAPVPPVQPQPLRPSHAPPQQRHYAPHQPLPPPPLSALPSVRNLPRISPLTDRPSKRSRLSARTMPSSASSASEAVDDAFPLVATRSYGSTSADVDESSLNDWEAVVEMYLHGTGAPDGVPLREICKGDGRRVHDRKLLEKRRTIGKTYELLGAPRFEAAIGYRWENGLRRKQKMYNVISRCRIVNAMRKAGEPIPDDFGTLTTLIDTRLREKERAKEERDAKRNAEQARLNAIAGTTRIAVMPGAARENAAAAAAAALVHRADAT